MAFVKKTALVPPKGRGSWAPEIAGDNPKVSQGIQATRRKWDYQASDAEGIKAVHLPDLWTESRGFSECCPCKAAAQDGGGG